MRASLFLFCFAFIVSNVVAQTPAPTTSPTGAPTTSPTGNPTTSPTGNPTESPTTASPSLSPTTGLPSVSPTSFPSASPTTFSIYVGEGWCQDNSGQDYDRIWYTSIPNATFCESNCHDTPLCVGYGYYDFLNRCYCYYSNGNTPVGVDESGSYTDFTGSGPIWTFQPYSGVHCYKFPSATTYAPTTPTESPTNSPTKFPTSVDLGNTPGTNPTAPPTEEQSWYEKQGPGTKFGVIFGGVIGAMVLLTSPIWIVKLKQSLTSGGRFYNHL